MPKYEVEIELNTLETMLVYIDAPNPAEARDVVETALEAMEPGRTQIATHFGQDWEGPETCVEVHAVRRAQSDKERQLLRFLAGMHSQMLTASTQWADGLTGIHRGRVAVLMADLSTLLDEWETLADKESQP